MRKESIPLEVGVDEVDTAHHVWSGRLYLRRNNAPSWLEPFVRDHPLPDGLNLRGSGGGVGAELLNSEYDPRGFVRVTFLGGTGNPAGAAIWLHTEDAHRTGATNPIEIIVQSYGDRREVVRLVFPFEPAHPRQSRRMTREKKG
jgi:hypothetical protein